MFFFYRFKVKNWRFSLQKCCPCKKNDKYKEKYHWQNLPKWQFSKATQMAIFELRLGHLVLALSSIGKSILQGSLFFHRVDRGLPLCFCVLCRLLCVVPYRLKLWERCASVETQVDYSECGSDIDISGQRVVQSRPVQIVETCTVAQVQRQLTLPRSAGVWGVWAEVST